LKEDENMFEFSQDIEILINIIEPFETYCWVGAQIVNVKRNFYLVEYEIGNKKVTKIIPNTNIRKKK
jgi:hypothetical protein